MNYNFSTPHRRFNPLTGEWVLVSPHRTQRPWQGKQEISAHQSKPKYDPDCYLCPGNVRANGEHNPAYTDTFVFENDFAALLKNIEPQVMNETDFMKAEAVKGCCRVICFTPNHNQTLATMEVPAIKKVIDVWANEVDELGKEFKWVQVFENRGEIMGASNPHPHCQVWATSFLPNEIRKEEDNQKKYFEKNKSVLLKDYLEYELKAKERIIVENDEWVCLVPFWAVWPFETMVLPKRTIKRITDLTAQERFSLAEALKKLLVKYDNLFQTSFPYTMGFHFAPMDKENYDHWQTHIHFYPPLLRSATVKKFMVGFEMLSEAQRDITPEIAAQRLRDLPEEHYLETGK